VGTPDSTADVLVIGGGMAGAAAAFVAGRSGMETVLVDPRTVFPACFKAEKLEPAQARLLRRIELFDTVRPVLTPIRHVLCARDAKLFGVEETEQYGVLYHDLVNRVRERMPASVRFCRDLVTGVDSDAAGSLVRLKSGATIRARLVVLATGVTERLGKQLGVERIWINRHHATAFAYDLATLDGEPFGFDALTYYPRDRLGGIACLSLFPIGEAMRANLFVYRGARDPWVKEFLADPAAVLEHDLAGLDRVTGGHRIASRIECAAIRLYQVEPPARDGLVLIGDAMQSACPATGTGLSKVLNDVDVLCNVCLPRWFETPGMRHDEILGFYRHPRKLGVDGETLDAAVYGRNVGTRAGVSWSLRAGLAYWRRRLGQRATLREYLRTRDAVGPTRRREPVG